MTDSNHPTQPAQPAQPMDPIQQSDEAPPAPPGYTAKEENAATKSSDSNRYYASAQQPEGAYNQQQQPAYGAQNQYVTPLDKLKEEPEWIDCPFCHQRAKTYVTDESSSMTMLGGILCCLVCVCLACVPCMTKWAYDYNHFCSACKKQVAHKPHDGGAEVCMPAAGAAGAPRPGQVASQYATAQPQQPQQPAPVYQRQPEGQADGIEAAPRQEEAAPYPPEKDGALGQETTRAQPEHGQTQETVQRP